MGVKELPAPMGEDRRDVPQGKMQRDLEGPNQVGGICLDIWFTSHWLAHNFPSSSHGNTWKLQGAGGRGHTQCPDSGKVARSVSEAWKRQATANEHILYGRQGNAGSITGP